MKITKKELKKIINENVKRQLKKNNYRKTNQRNNYMKNKNNHKKKINERSNIEYKYFPNNKKELQKIIEQEIKMNGINCDLNMIDTSKIKNMSKLFFKSKFNGDISN